VIEFVKDAILSHAKQDVYRECCGLVIVFKGRYRYIPGTNLSDTPHTKFFLDPKCWIQAEDQGRVVAVVHSHIEGSLEPSDADRTGCEQTQIPWIICNPNTDEIIQIEPCGYTAPIIGRQYSYGIHDCYTLARDYLRQRDILLPDFSRVDPERAITTGEYGFTEENIRAAHGRDVAVNELQPNDFIIFQIQNSLDHCGVYVGDQRILHHVRNRLSSVDIYGGYWLKQTARCLRYDANY